MIMQMKPILVLIVTAQKIFHAMSTIKLLATIFT